MASLPRLHSSRAWSASCALDCCAEDGVDRKDKALARIPTSRRVLILIIHSTNGETAYLPWPPSSGEYRRTSDGQYLNWKVQCLFIKSAGCDPDPRAPIDHAIPCSPGAIMPKILNPPST